MIAMGDTLRRLANSGTAAGHAVRSAMQQGELLDDELIIDIVRTRLDQPDTFNGFVLDGFPRTVQQAAALEILLDDRGPLAAVELAVPTAMLVQRLQARRVCDGCGRNATGLGHCACGGTPRCRADDTDAIITERLRVYERATKPLTEFYRRRRILHVVDGTSAMDTIAERILETLRRPQTEYR
jgi:adenylate kinase